MLVGWGLGVQVGGSLGSSVGVFVAWGGRVVGISVAFTLSVGSGVAVMGLIGVGSSVTGGILVIVGVAVLRIGLGVSVGITTGINFTVGVVNPGNGELNCGAHTGPGKMSDH